VPRSTSAGRKHSELFMQSKGSLLSDNQNDPRPLLTIAIPTYNRAKLLQSCLDGITKIIGTCAEVEVLVLDNCSTDGTEWISRSWVNSVRDLMSARYIRREKNIGAVGNILLGVREANGKYFTFIGDDDAFTKNGFRSLLISLREAPEFSIGVESDYFIDVSSFYSVEERSQALENRTRYLRSSAFYKFGNAWSGIINVDKAKPHLDNPDLKSYLSNNLWGHTGLAYSVALSSNLPVLILNFHYGWESQKRPFRTGGASSVTSSVDLLTLSGFIEDKFGQRLLISDELLAPKGPIDSYINSLFFTWPSVRFRDSILWKRFSDLVRQFPKLNWKIRLKLRLLETLGVPEIGTILYKIRSGQGREEFLVENFWGPTGIEHT
jgi:glycosyltransferase involved in cell wall biosynthesis